jgi:hypothetical protein
MKILHLLILSIFASVVAELLDFVRKIKGIFFHITGKNSCFLNFSSLITKFALTKSHDIFNA